MMIISLGSLSVAAKDIDYATAHLGRRLVAVKINERITIDGSLDEPAWEKAAIATDFIQKEPAFNATQTLDSGAPMCVTS